MTNENKDRLEEIFKHALLICQGTYSEGDLLSEADFLDRLADYLCTNARTIRNLKDVIKDL